MDQAYFEKLPDRVCEQLRTATQGIKIAVCWFSHGQIFREILLKAQQGVRVELLLEYDSQNIRPAGGGGLDFQQFIGAGGQLFASQLPGLMHHKFALLDDGRLLTGSFNWTYNQNAENLIVTDSPEMVGAFAREFDRQKLQADRIFKVRPELVKPFAAFPLSEKSYFPLTELRRKVSMGTKTWFVKISEGEWPVLLSNSCVTFDPQKHLEGFWAMSRAWNGVLFETTLLEGMRCASPAQLRHLKVFCQKMLQGDLLFAVDKSSKLLGLGIVQSELKPLQGEKYSSFRDVHWLKECAAADIFLSGKIGAGAVGRARGSVLEVLQWVFEEDFRVARISIEKI